MTKFAEDIVQIELKIEAVKANMKKMPIKENIAKVVELKQLQQQVKNMRNKDHNRNNEVTTHQSSWKNELQGSFIL